MLVLHGANPRGGRVITAALSGLAEPAVPPRSLRGRVAGLVAPTRRAQSWNFAFAGVTAAALALLIFSIWAAQRSNGVRRQLESVRNERDQLRAAVETLSASQIRAVQFGRENMPHGRVFVTAGRGLVFVGADLPSVPFDRTLELWLIPNQGAPRPAGLFRPDPSGQSVHVSSTPVDLAQTKAIAISIEPRQGSGAPTTKPILIVPLG